MFGIGVADTGMKGAGDEGFTDAISACADEATGVKPKSTSVSEVMFAAVKGNERFQNGMQENVDGVVGFIFIAR